MSSLFWLEYNLSCIYGYSWLSVCVPVLRVDTCLSQYICGCTISFFSFTLMKFTTLCLQSLLPVLIPSLVVTQVYTGKVEPGLFVFGCTSLYFRRFCSSECWVTESFHRVSILFPVFHSFIYFVNYRGVGWECCVFKFP